MDEICLACKKPVNGLQVTKITDGMMSADGEFDPQNTEVYHTDCITVDW